MGGFDYLMEKLFHPLTVAACRFFNLNNFKLGRNLCFIGALGIILHAVLGCFVFGTEPVWYAALVAPFWVWIGSATCARIDRLAVERATKDLMSIDEVQLIMVRWWWALIALVTLVSNLVTFIVLGGTLFQWIFAFTLFFFAWGTYAATDYHAGGKSVWAWLWERRPHLVPAPKLATN